MLYCYIVNYELIRARILTAHVGNTGIGFEALKALCQSQTAYEILLGCRTISKGENASE